MNRLDHCQTIPGILGRGIEQDQAQVCVCTMWLWGEQERVRHNQEAGFLPLTAHPHLRYQVVRVFMLRHPVAGAGVKERSSESQTFPLLGSRFSSWCSAECRGSA
jgi:hypothetical protein